MATVRDAWMMKAERMGSSLRSDTSLERTPMSTRLIGKSAVGMELASMRAAGMGQHASARGDAPQRSWKGASEKSVAALVSVAVLQEMPGICGCLQDRPRPPGGGRAKVGDGARKGGSVAVGCVRSACAIGDGMVRDDVVGERNSGCASAKNRIVLIALRKSREICNILRDGQAIVLSALGRDENFGTLITTDHR
jgi:hypothetical protein